MITLQKLEQYRGQRKELEQLKRTIDSLADRPASIVTDSVRASHPEYPYTEHTIIIQGESKRAQNRRTKLLQLYGYRIMVNEKDLMEVEQWLDAVQDAKLRQLIRGHYIQGSSWRVTATKVYGAPCYEDAAKKRVYRFFQNSKSC